jgi:hypothetical protein
MFMLLRQCNKKINIPLLLCPMNKIKYEFNGGGSGSGCRYSIKGCIGMN